MMKRGRESPRPGPEGDEDSPLEEDEIEIPLKSESLLIPCEDDPLGGEEEGHQVNVVGKRNRVTALPLPGQQQVQKNNLPSFDNEVEFSMEMNRNVAYVINEAVYLFGMDPREYHPFYLRVYKYIAIGQKMGYFKSSKDVDSCWEKFDRFCSGMMRNPNPKGTFTGVESPYATFIKTGRVMLNGKEISLKRDEEEIQKTFAELEKAAKNIWEEWRRKGKDMAIIDDLSTRLEFFNHCKSMTFPADCVRVNKLWYKFLHEFAAQQEQPLPCSPGHVPVPESGSESIRKSKVISAASSTQSKRVTKLRARAAQTLKKLKRTGQGLEHVEKMICSKRTISKIKSLTNKRPRKGTFASSSRSQPASDLNAIEEETHKSLTNLAVVHNPSSTSATQGLPDQTPPTVKNAFISEAEPTETIAVISNSTKLHEEKIDKVPKEKKTFSCDECGDTFSNQHSVKAHKITVHQDRMQGSLIKEKCPLCVQEFSCNGSGLWRHFQVSHMERINVEMVHDPAGIPPPSSHDPKRRKETERDNQSKYGYEMGTGSSTYQCQHCGKSFGTFSFLKRHIVQKHGTGDKSFLCQDCPKQFKSKDSLDAHRRQVHLGQDFRCDICSRVMQGGGKLWKHKVDIHGMSGLEPPPGVNVMQCDVCGERLLRGMLQHMEKNHPENVERFKEEQKNKKTRVPVENANGKKRHTQSEEVRLRAAARKREARRKWIEEGVGPAWIRRDKSIVPKQCPYCKEEFPEGHRSTKAWSAHLEEVHQIRIEMKWVCPKPNCDKRFLRKCQLDCHVRQGHSPIDIVKTLEEIKFAEKSQQDEWRCLVCQKNLKMKDALLIHFVLEHQPTLKKIRDNDDTPYSAITEPLDCPHCEEKQSTHDTFREHMELVHSDKCWKCPECEWVVISPTDLQEHFMLEHNTPDPIAEWKNKDKNNRNKSRKYESKQPKTRKAKPPRNDKAIKDIDEHPQSSHQISKRTKKAPRKTTKTQLRRGRPAKNKHSYSDMSGSEDNESCTYSDSDEEGPSDKLPTPTISTNRRGTRSSARLNAKSKSIQN